MDLEKIKDLHNRGKIELYAASIQAWYMSRLQKDKSILALSAGGIGLLVTIFINTNLRSGWTLLLFVLPVVSFIASIFSVIKIFHKNTAHIEGLTVDIFGRGPTSKEVKQLDSHLSKLDRFTEICFALGIILSIAFGLLHF